VLCLVVPHSCAFKLQVRTADFFFNKRSTNPAYLRPSPCLDRLIPSRVVVAVVGGVVPRSLCLIHVHTSYKYVRLTCSSTREARTQHTGTFLLLYSFSSSSRGCRGCASLCLIHVYTHKQKTHINKPDHHEGTFTCSCH
jgi:hypothetical protein